jgi:hypothetical protein
MASAWHNQPELKVACVSGLQAQAAAGTLVRRRDDPAHGGFHLALTAGKLAQERDVPVSDLVVDGGTSVRWLDESERLWGLPQVVGGLLDRCFERLPATEAADFAVAAVQAIPVGADLSRVPVRWVLDLLADNESGVTAHVAPPSTAIERVADLFRRTLTGEDIAVGEWQAAATAAQAESAQANAVERGGPGATATATAFAAAAAYAPDLLPSEARMAAWRASVTLADEAAAARYQAAYLMTEAFAQAAEYAVNTVEAVADKAFRAVLEPIREAAGRARAAEGAGRTASPADAAAANQARQAADAAMATCVEYHRWQARRLIHHLAEAGGDSDS